jgi:diaminopimelate epimerase
VKGPFRFAKAHGLANDFVLVEGDPSAIGPAAAEWAGRICDRHTGIGGDGVIVYAVRDGSSMAMRLFNSDGSDGDLSGNGLRCLSAYVVAQGRLPESHVVETPPGPRAVKVSRRAGASYRVEADLGEPVLASAGIPVQLDPPQPRVVDHPLEVAGETLRITATSMGNPHCTLLLDQPADDARIASLGPALERHPFFPRRTNVEFAVAVGRGELAVRFWERGVGPTRASGTGSAAAAVAAILHDRVDRRVRVVCEGGVLEVSWPEGGSLRQTGDVELLFEGEWLPE